MKVMPTRKEDAGWSSAYGSHERIYQSSWELGVLKRGDEGESRGREARLSPWPVVTTITPHSCCRYECTQMAPISARSGPPVLPQNLLNP